MSSIESGVPPTVQKVTRRQGIAGQYSIDAQVDCHDGEGPMAVSFVGSLYGGPVVMVSPSGMQVFVDQAVVDYCGGTLDEAWVRRFFEPRREEVNGG